MDNDQFERRTIDFVIDGWYLMAHSGGICKTRSQSRHDCMPVIPTCRIPIHAHDADACTDVNVQPTKADLKSHFRG